MNQLNQQTNMELFVVMGISYNADYNTPPECIKYFKSIISAKKYLEQIAKRIADVYLANDGDEIVIPEWSNLSIEQLLVEE